MNLKRKADKFSIKITFISILSVVIVLLLATSSCVKTEENKSLSSALTTDLSKHLLYSEYQFDNSENVINLGTQPLYMPTGLITEAMKRDNILKEALKKLGMEIRFYSFLKGHDVNFFLKKGDLDAGIGGDMSAITIASTSEIIIPSLFQHGFVSIVADRHMLIEDLRGKRIGYALGSNAHYSLLNVLHLAGLDETDVNLIPMDVDEMPEALAAGRINAFSAWEPTPFLTTTEYPDKIIIHRSLSTGYLYFQRALYEKHPEALRLTLAAGIRAFYWMKNRKDNMLRASRWVIDEGKGLSERISILSDIEVRNLAMNDIMGHISVPFISVSGFSDDSMLHKEFVFLKGLGKVPSSTAWKKVSDSFNLQILDDILNDSSGYLLNEFDYDLDGEGNER